MEKERNVRDIEVHKKQIIEKGQFILNQKVNELSDEDKDLQEFIGYILKDGFSTRYIKLPANINTDTNSLNCFLKYIEIIYEIFLVSPNKRKEIYSSEFQYVEQEIKAVGQKIKEFKQLFGQKTKDLTTGYSNDKKYILESIKDSLKRQKRFLSLLELYQIYFCSLLSEPDILKYSFYKLNKYMYINYFGDINYNYYGANFDNKICLEIISLYLEEIKNRNEEHLNVYINIIFHFTWLFNRDYNKLIDKNILRRAIQKTNLKIKEKQITKNKSMIGPIFLSYLMIEINIPKQFLNIKNIEEISNYYLKDEIQGYNQKKNNNSTESSDKSNEHREGNNNNKFNNGENSTGEIIEIKNNTETDAKTIEELNEKIKLIIVENNLRFEEQDKKISELKEEIENVKSKLNNIML